MPTPEQITSIVTAIVTAAGILTGQWWMKRGKDIDALKALYGQVGVMSIEQDRLRRRLNRIGYKLRKLYVMLDDRPEAQRLVQEMSAIALEDDGEDMVKSKGQPKSLEVKEVQ